VICVLRPEGLSTEIANSSAHTRREKILFRRSGFPAANQPFADVALEIGNHQSNATVAKLPMEIAQHLASRQVHLGNGRRIEDKTMQWIWRRFD
jgi:hypothetical protein